MLHLRRLPRLERLIAFQRPVEGQTENPPEASCACDTAVAAAAAVQSMQRRIMPRIAQCWINDGQLTQLAQQRKAQVFRNRCERVQPRLVEHGADRVVRVHAHGLRQAVDDAFEPKRAEPWAIRLHTPTSLMSVLK